VVSGEVVLEGNRLTTRGPGVCSVAPRPVPPRPGRAAVHTDGRCLPPSGVRARRARGHVVLDRPDGPQRSRRGDGARAAGGDQAVSARDDVRVIVLSGRGPVFCAGPTSNGWPGRRLHARGEPRRRSGLLDLSRRSTPPRRQWCGGPGAALGGGAGLLAVVDVAGRPAAAPRSASPRRGSAVPAVISPTCCARSPRRGARALPHRRSVSTARGLSALGSCSAWSPRASSTPR